MDHLSDLDLVEAAKAGDTTSFGELVRRHGPRLLALARQVVGPDAAEDVIQEAMVDAYRGLAGFAGHAAVGTWLYRIALNRCLQERRRTKPLMVDTEPLELLARWEDPDYSVDPALVAVRRSHAETLQSVLAQLPEGYRNALLLHDGHGLTAAELGRGNRHSLGHGQVEYPPLPPGPVHALGPGRPRPAGGSTMTELSCPLARSMVSDYIDGDLPPGQARSLEEHLQACPFCPPLYASLVETLDELKGLDDVSGVDKLVRRVLAALAEPPGPDDPLPRQT